MNDSDRLGTGELRIRQMPMLVSTDLVTWRFAGQAVPSAPAWAAKGARLWAPDVFYSTTFDHYYMTFAVTNTVASLSGEPGCPLDRAIAVADSASPLGPWKVRSTPLVGPRRLAPGCTFASTIDPEVVGQALGSSGTIMYGGFRGGVLAQSLAIDAGGVHLSGTPTLVAHDRKFEAPNAIYHDGWYYLVLSSGDCCNGAFSGYSAFVARARHARGPFVDADGRTLTETYTGGTPFLFATGNRWTAPGHTSLFADASGQWWVAYHAVDRFQPTFGSSGAKRRPALLDPVDWVDGWPVVRAGRGPSTGPVARPAAQPGQVTSYRPHPVPDVPLGATDLLFSDEFEAPSLDAGWHVVRATDPPLYTQANGSLAVETTDTQLRGEENSASVLLRAAPPGDFTVETRLDFDLPPTGDVPVPAQAGVIVYRDDDAYLTLTMTAAGDTRQTAFADEQTLPDGTIAHGSTAVGPAGATTWLRIRRSTPRSGVGHNFTASTSVDGIQWRTGSTWKDDSLADDTTQIGLVGMGGAGFHADFDYLRVWTSS